MTPGRPALGAVIPDAVCSCGAVQSVRAVCCVSATPGQKCPRGVCKDCGRTWRRVPKLLLAAMGAGTRDLERYPSTQPLRDRATP